MTQMVTVTDNWLDDLHKAIYEFEQEYGVEPHMYANPELGSKIIATMNCFTVKLCESDDFKPGKVCYFEGKTIEFDWDVDKDTVILKA